VILPVLFADDIAWKMMGDITSAMTTAIASLIKWLPAELSTTFLRPVFPRLTAFKPIANSSQIGMPSYQPRQKETSTLADGVFIANIDYNMAVWLAYSNCIQIPVIGRHVEDFANVVRILAQMILPEWQDDKYRQDLTESAGQPIAWFGAITNLLHRRNFFAAIKGNDFGHL